MNDGLNVTQKKERQSFGTSGHEEKNRVSRMVPRIGMTIDETYFLTSSMINSGKRITFIKEVLDKHSTGGVGDKVTIALIPILASMGYSVLKMSRKRTSVILGRNS